jgi:hypothetical protein
LKLERVRGREREREVLLEIGGGEIWWIMLGIRKRMKEMLGGVLH